MREERKTPLPWGLPDSRGPSEAPDDERAVSANDPRNHAVAVVGLGYVGLPTALALADVGCQVIGYDISEDRISEACEVVLDATYQATRLPAWTHL